MVVLSASMPKAGSGWFYNLTNDLLVALGHPAAQTVRTRYRLQRVLRDANCRVTSLDGLTLTRLALPALLGATYAVKTHRAPTPWLRRFVRARLVRVTYIYRDPRDVAVSAFEHGERMRRNGRTQSFAALTTPEDAIAFAGKLAHAWQRWHHSGLALPVQYEALLADPVAVLRTVSAFLELTVDDARLAQVVAPYRRERVGSATRGVHFNKGVVQRYREVLTDAQLDLCHTTFGHLLPTMGYTPDAPLPAE